MKIFKHADGTETVAEEGSFRASLLRNQGFVSEDDSAPVEPVAVVEVEPTVDTEDDGDDGDAETSSKRSKRR